ncbi:MAG: hypothetical protein AVO33_06895 [delta proteobacterium ML8_F1]|nr:MAG: hypothetical protein AVO33_06895 [delta proteobacterium ML8_F1]
MKKIILLLILTIMAVTAFTGCSQPEATQKPVIITSIVPTKTFIENIVGDTYEVVAIVPPGASPASYQPTPDEMLKISQAAYYFSIAVPTEVANILPKISEFNEEVQLVMVNELVAETYPERYFEEDHEEDHEEEEEGHDHEGRDPHIWLSPLRVMEMLRVITDTLVADHPEHREAFEASRDAYLGELESLHEYILEETAALPNRAFIMYHPSYGYFAEDYGFEMLAIEDDGKEETAKGIEQIISYARENNIRVIFYQAEFDSEQAETVARELDGVTKMLTPLSPDYVESLKEAIDAFKSVY